MGTLRLPVTLTTEDRLSVAAEMSAAQTALEAVKAEKKSEMAEYNEQIKGHEATVHDRNSILRAGVVHRDVQVETRDDPETGKKVTWRLDTNVPVRAVDLDPDERQVLLGLDGPKVLQGGKADATEEQLVAGSPEEAEALRAERLALERAERISAAVSEERLRITVIRNKADGPLEGTLQYGGRTLTGIGPTDDECRDSVVAQLVPLLEEQEDAAAAKKIADAAEKVRAEREARIEAALAEVSPRIHVLAQPNEANPMQQFKATLQLGNAVIEAEAETQDAAYGGALTQARERLEAEEDQADVWADVAAASDAEQKRQEVEQLAADQAADEAATKKRTVGGGLKKGGLKVPPGHKRKKKGEAQDPDKSMTPLTQSPPSELEETKAYFGEAGDLQPVNAAAREAEGVLCEPACDLHHDHTADRTSF